jgi:hypothetical protein
MGSQPKLPEGSDIRDWLLQRLDEDVRELRKTIGELKDDLAKADKQIAVLGTKVGVIAAVSAIVGAGGVEIIAKFVK